jgi:predicted RNase H-like HicB family nuclease
MKPSRLLVRLASGEVTNVEFSDALRLVEALGCEELRIAGSHDVFARPGIAEQLNLQDRRGQAKPYQPRQLMTSRSEGRGGQVKAPTYPINVFWSVEDDSWVADAPDLAYCSAVGDAPHEAVAEVEIAIKVWLEAATSSRRAVPEPSARMAQA